MLAKNKSVDENQNQFVVLTGASTGIGLAITKYLIDQGFYVFGSVREESIAQKLELQLKPNFKPLLMDIRCQDDIQKAKEIVERIIGDQTLTAIINNAGISIHGPLQFLPMDDIKKQFDVNVFGTLMVTKTFLELLGARQPPVKKPGKIINISSVSGLFTTPFLTPYCASKFALESITDGLRRELFLYGIDVISVLPGPIKSEILSKAKKDDRKWDGTIYQKIFTQNHAFIDKIQSNALPAARIAKLVNHIINSKHPKSRYIITSNPIYLWIHKYLPTRWVDRLYKLAYRKFLISK